MAEEYRLPKAFVEAYKADGEEVVVFLPAPGAPWTDPGEKIRLGDLSRDELLALIGDNPEGVGSVRVVAPRPDPPAQPGPSE